MKNVFVVLILIHFICLTSCNTDYDTSLTDAKSITEEIASKDSLADEVSFSLSHPTLEDSSKYYFFVENEAGMINYKRYDFSLKTWHPYESLFQKSFMGGPLHSGRVIYQRTLWKDSVRHLLYAKDIDRGMAVEIQPLAEILINNDNSHTIFIWVPVNSTYRLSDCSHFDDWFTYCNQQRFFVKYWIEHQFTPRYIKRIQWKPLNIQDY